MSVDAARFAFVYDRLKQGWSQAAAGAVARALHPFDDAPAPSRALETAIRRRNRLLATELRNLDETGSIGAARRAVADYAALASNHGEARFAHQWRDLERVIVGIQSGGGAGSEQPSMAVPRESRSPRRLVRLTGHLEGCEIVATISPSRRSMHIEDAAERRSQFGLATADRLWCDGTVLRWGNLDIHLDAGQVEKAKSLVDSMGGMWDESSIPAPPPPPSEVIETDGSVVASELERLAQLFEDGYLTDDEFSALKGYVISRIHRSRG